MTRWWVGQPLNHNIWWYERLAPHSILGLCRCTVYDMWTVCGVLVDCPMAAGAGSSDQPAQGRLVREFPGGGSNDEEEAVSGPNRTIRVAISRPAGIGDRKEALLVR